ncbi:MAG TPA: nuclear transport factor 2 family protein [Rudaea sp.]|nr:nuclear transport factor 2 family protein [Rudaea sp.]
MRIAIVLVIVALACAAHAEEPKFHGNPAAARAIAKADTDFAALAKREGTAKAFRDTMDEVDGTAYGGGSEPSVGRDAIYAAMGGDAPDDSTLEWAPVEVFADKGGDMGVSRGRWTSTVKASGKSISGSYVTVWRKNAKGEWKGLVDIGNVDKPK